MACKTAAKADTVKVTFNVVLENATADDVIYLVGSFNNWDATKGVALKKNAKGIYAASKSFAKGTTGEFKICKTASWDNVEKSCENTEVANHTFAANEANTVTVTVYNWN